MAKTTKIQENKTQERQRLQNDIDAFLSAGGKIERLERNTNIVKREATQKTEEPATP